MKFSASWMHGRQWQHVVRRVGDTDARGDVAKLLLLLLLLLFALTADAAYAVVMR